MSIIKYPIITDKATRLLANNQYSFVVNPKSDKLTIKAAIEYLFNVKVVKINTAHLPKKKKRIGQNLGWKSHCNVVKRRYNKLICRRKLTII
jgi:large subunit ribosomal protein L23